MEDRLCAARFRRGKPAHQSEQWLPESGLIWHPDEVETHYEQPVNSYCRFRNTFHLPDRPKRGTIRIFADSRYQLFVNGSYAGRGPCRSDPRWQYYDVIDILPLLRQGENTIAVLALYYGYGTGQSISRIPALLAEAGVETESQTVNVPSGTGWKCSKSEAYESGAPRINGCQGPAEIIDFRREPEDWRSPEYNDSDWTPAKRRNLRLTPFWNLVPRPIPMLKEEIIDSIAIVNQGAGHEKRYPVDSRHKQLIAEETTIAFRPGEPVPSAETALDPAAGGTFHLLTYDFGRIEPGYLQLEVSGPPGAVIDAVYAEHLWEGKALLNEDNNRSFDSFILSGRRDAYEIAFGWKACRYVQLRVRNPDGLVKLHRVGMRKRTYPVDQHATFACNDGSLGQIWELSEHTLRICMQDAFVDSPSREQQQWMGDGRSQALMNYYFTGDGRLHRKLLEQIGQSQDWHGMTTSRYPDGHHNYPPIPSFCLQWICSFGEYMQYTGDKEPLGQWWPNIIAALRWFSAYENEEGLLADVPYWAYIDAGETPEGRALDVSRGGIVTGLNLQYLEALQRAVSYARIVGDEEACFYYDKLAAKLADRIRNRLWNEEQGAYADCLVDGRLSGVVSEPVNALALLHLHEPGDARTGQIVERVFEHSNDSVSEPAVAGSPYSMLLIYQALRKAGRTGRALELIRSRYQPMLDAGATTVWEYWKLFYREKQSGLIRFGSACHAWASAPLVCFIEAVLGVRPESPGFRRVSLRPNLFDLAWAEGSVPTACGELRIRADKQKEGTWLKFTVPSGCEIVCMDRVFGAGTFEVLFVE
ncbi:family 78 glycoside hydrolase catalytic domain [Paenibacillus beijingensis]|uniref:Uncharacterized protein n=1 Tax=Paenibacillus beijingensis TaxID=1126833 RepID=A0A0D5NJQ3_9BACL|nr:family 78 glycoside hydrolase catalytic domain [Paenibacillus beijingensis]AJY75345.1 hypothetical protein VN24_13135 [Paenibacillus beijingensis]